MSCNDYTMDLNIYNGHTFFKPWSCNHYTMDLNIYNGHTFFKPWSCNHYTMDLNIYNGRTFLNHSFNQYTMDLNIYNGHTFFKPWSCNHYTMDLNIYNGHTFFKPLSCDDRIIYLICLICVCAILGFAINPGKLWILETGRFYYMHVRLFDAENNRIAIDNVSIYFLLLN